MNAVGLLPPATGDNNTTNRGRLRLRHKGHIFIYVYQRAVKKTTSLAFLFIWLKTTQQSVAKTPFPLLHFVGILFT